MIRITFKIDGSDELHELVGTTEILSHDPLRLTVAHSPEASRLSPGLKLSDVVIQREASRTPSSVLTGNRNPGPPPQGNRETWEAAVVDAVQDIDGSLRIDIKSV